MMKNKFAKKLLAFALTGAMLLALAACTKTPQEPETPAAQPSAPETPVTPEEPSPAEMPAEPEEPAPAQPEQPSDPEPETPKLATDEELLRLVEMQDTDRPAQTPFLISRTDSDSSVVFRVEFRSASGWLLYGAKEYEASFNDDGGHLVSTMWLSTYDTPQLSAQATDPEALMSLVINMEVGMLGEHGFNFSDPSEFTSDELYTAYLLLAAEEELQARYNEAEQKYFISTRHITAVLDRYFKDYSFDITQCSQYDATFDGIVTSTVSGFGGNRFMKILNVSQKEGTLEVRFDADFYADETEKDVTMQKSYTIEFYDDGYYYLSAMEFVVN